MEQILEREELFKKYLLGVLDERGQEEVELLLLADERYLEELLLVEDELTDDFVFGVLSEHEQQMVEERFLAAPERQQNFMYTVTLRQYLSRHEAPETAYPVTPADVFTQWARRWSSLADTLRLWLSTLAGALRRLFKGRAEPLPAPLAEAQKNRAILSSLMENDWTGLRLLSLVNSGQLGRRDLAATLGVSETSVAPALARLVECGLLKKRGRVFFCTAAGTEILRKLETVSGAKILPD